MEHTKADRWKAEDPLAGNLTPLSKGYRGRKNVLLEKEQVYQALNQWGIPYDAVEHPAAFTMEEIQELGLLERGPICKNLLLRDSKGRNFYLLVVLGDKHVDLKALAGQLNSSRLGFASEHRLEEYLGVRQGSVSPLGVLYDQEGKVQVLLDRELVDQPLLGVHPNENTATLWLSYDHLLSYFDHCNHKVRLVDLE